MASKERIEEVARICRSAIGREQTGMPGMQGGLERDLAKLPEFQEPASPWVECSKRLPDIGLRVLLFGVQKHSSKHEEIPGTRGAGETWWSYRKEEIQLVDRWMPIPEYVPQESELVRRFREKYFGKMGNLSITLVVGLLKETEKELDNGK